jgi:hypothetical protein
MWSILLVGLSLMQAEVTHPNLALALVSDPIAPVDVGIEAHLERSHQAHAAVNLHASRTVFNCPNTLDALIPKLLDDLPSYSNRVIQRSRDRSRTVDIPPSYVLLAGRSDQEPIPLGGGDYAPLAGSDNVQQVFFTTLERQYGASGLVQLQGYYWMFVVRSPEAWQLVNLRTSLGDYPSRLPPTPPRDSNDGVVAQAVRLWLRDCHAGALRDES